MLQQDSASLVTQAQALIGAGDFLGAKPLYEQLCRLDPANAAAWQALGVIHGQMGDLEQSIACLRKAIDLQPEQPEARYNLGYLLQAQGQLTEALAHLEQAVRLRPGYAEAWLLLGMVNGRLAAYTQAAECCRRVADLRPDSVDAYMGLGNALRHQGNNREAAEAFEMAVRLRPDFPEALIALGYAYQAEGRHELVVANLQKVVSLRPDSYEAHLGIGRSLLPLGRPDEAREYCEKAVRLHPHPVDAIVQLATLADHAGDIHKAYELLRPLIEGGVNNIAAALVFARASKELGLNNEAIAYVERVLASNPPMSASLRRRVLFSLGRLHDKSRNYDRAFDLYRQANAAKQAHFDADLQRAETDTTIAVHSPEFMARMPRASVLSDRPVFVVGMMRSGTTLVEQILSSHPAVFGAEELPDILRLTKSLPARLGADEPYPQCLTQLTQELIDELAQSYLGRLDTFSVNAARVVDKMPGNFRHLGLINLLFPDARVIHCLRDPRDICVSMYSLDFVEGADYAFDLAQLGEFYRDYRRLMRHWREVLTIPMFELQYEQLVTDPEQKIRELVAFCGLEWDDCCLDFHETRRYDNPPSYDQVRQPMYSKSAGRWKNYEHHLGALLEALGDEVENYNK